MKRVKACLQSIYASERGRWITAAVFAALLYLLAVLLQPVITFYDNDDLNIAWALAGYRSGAPSFSHPFLNCITASAVSALYTAFPGVPWWYAVQTACLLIAVACVASCALRIASRRRLPVLLPFAILAVICAGTFYYAIAQVMFTLTSASLGMAAAAMALAADEADARRTYALYLSGGVMLLALSFLIRQSAGLCAACFFIASLLYRLLAARRAKAGYARIFAALAATVLLTAGLTAANGWGRAHQNAEGFMEFENARASYMDYPHDFEYENPALYESIGWDGTLQELVDAWFYMDDRVTADALATASEGSAFHNQSIPARLSYAWDFAGAFLGKYPIAAYLAVICACAFVGLLLSCVICRSRAELISGACTLLGAMALLGFLFYSGRMNLRAFMSILFPAIAMLLLFAMAGFRAPADGAPMRKVCASLAIGCGLLAVLSLFCAYKVFRTVVSYDSVDTLQTARAVSAYAMAHPDALFIRDVYTANNFDALTTYPDAKPTNLMDWGGCDTLTRAREAQWRANGYAGAQNASVFLDTDVYYLCNPADRYLPLLYGYMCENHGASEYEILDWIAGDVAVVRFVR